MDAAGSHNAADRSNVLLPAGRNAAAALRHQGTIAAASATCGRNCHCCREHYPRQHLLRTQDADAQGTTSRSCGTRSAPAPTVSDRQWRDWCRWCVLLSRGSRSGFAGDRWYKVWTEETRQQYITPTVDCDRNRMWPRLQNQPVQILYWLVNQVVPPEDWKHGSRPGNTLVVQFDWRSRTKFVLAAF